MNSLMAFRLSNQSLQASRSTDKSGSYISDIFPHKKKRTKSDKP